jgi:hypothetical protein
LAKYKRLTIKDKRQFLTIMVAGLPLSVAAQNLGIDLSQADRLNKKLSKRVPISLAEFDQLHAKKQ